MQKAKNQLFFRSRGRRPSKSFRRGLCFGFVAELVRRPSPSVATLAPSPLADCVSGCDEAVVLWTRLLPEPIPADNGREIDCVVYKVEGFAADVVVYIEGELCLVRFA